MLNWFILKGKNLVQWPSSFSEDSDFSPFPDSALFCSHILQSFSYAPLVCLSNHSGFDMHFLRVLQHVFGFIFSWKHSVMNNLAG